MAFKIYGASDDLVEIEGPGGDELNCDGANIVIGQEEATDGQNASGIRIAMRYVAGGVWEARVSPIDEDVPCPWPIQVGVNKYTAVVIVDCPEGTPIKWKRVRSKGH